MEMNDYLSMKALEKEGMSPYEQFKVGHMQSKRASGTAIGALAVGVGAAVAAVAAGAWAGAKAHEAKEVAKSQHDDLRELVKLNAQSIAGERAERIAGDVNITTTINDTLSGSQQGSQSQTVTQDVVQQVIAGLMTGRYSENAQKVELMSPARPFKCGCGCGCDND